LMRRWYCWWCCCCCCCVGVGVIVSRLALLHMLCLRVGTDDFLIPNPYSKFVKKTPPFSWRLASKDLEKGIISGWHQNFRDDKDAIFVK
jgi:hypothetical protein